MKIFNRLKDFFRLKLSKKAEKTVRNIKRSEQKQASPLETSSVNYKLGGCMGRNLGAIYYPPTRGKIKGYMK